MIEFAHDDFFTLKNRKKKNYLKTGICTKDNIIQHPNFPFDAMPGGGYARSIQMEIEYEEPMNRRNVEWASNVHIMPNELYHQKFRLKQVMDVSLLQDFMDECLNFFTLNAFPDEILWYETGYWSIKDCRNQFMGMGLNTLEHAIQNMNTSVITFCLANRDSVIIIHSNLKNGKSPVTDIDIYITNAFLPFTEVADIYRNGIKRLHKAINLKTEFILESALHFQYSLRCSFQLNVKAFVMMESYPVLIVIKNPVRNRRRLASLNFIIVPNMGGYSKNSTNPKRKFWLRVDQWRFEDTDIFEFFLIPWLNLFGANGMTAK